MTTVMRTLGRTGLKVSTLGLGTVEIGLPYGIRQHAPPDEGSAIKLIQTAYDRGITFFDTARSYGFAEERIRKSGIVKKTDVIIATKCCEVLDKISINSLTDSENIRKKIIEDVEKSLKTLNIEFLPLVQLHGGNEQTLKTGVIQETMDKLKSQGKVKFVGISTRGEKATMAAIEDGFFDTLQVAYSILDQRLSKFALPEAQKHNLGVINRSVLLKGALTDAVSLLPDTLSILKKNSNLALKIAEELGISLPNLAIRFALSNTQVDTILIGTTKIENIESSITAVQDGVLPDGVMAELKTIAVAEVEQVDPAKW